MIINNKDIALFGAKLLSKEFESSTNSISKEWLKTSSKPLITSKKFTYGSGVLELFLENKNEVDLMENVSNLINEISESVINFGDVFYYKVTLNNSTEEEVFYNVLNETYVKKIKLTLTVDELYKDYVQINLSSSMSITLQGNKSSECILEITPTQAMVDLIITGFSKEPIKIKNLAKDVKVILNGEDKIITANGINKFSDSDFWEFPYLIPGVNTINFSKTYFTGIVKYKPRYV